MALVTIQRSPSVTGSPHTCSNSDGEADEDEGNKHDKSECFFASKGTALVLALKDIPQYAERRLSTDSTRSTNSTQSNNSDIQQHLQSMFNLLQHEETLKMAVKLESQRPNRTRYLVIVSRCCYRRTSTSERRSKIMRHNSAKAAATTSALLNTASVVAVTAAPAATVTATGTTAAAAAAGTNASSNIAAAESGTTTQRQLSVDSHRDKVAQHLSQLATSTALSALSAASATTADGTLVTQRLSTTTTAPNLCAIQRQSIKCDGDKEYAAAGDSKTAVGIEESCLLGIDCNERSTIGLVVPILADTTIHLDGDGGFSVSVYGKTHIFKPVSVQAMWSALQTLHKVSQKARENNFYPGGPSHDWLAYYDGHIESDQSCLNEWNAMDSIESRRPPSPDAIRNKPTAKEETESIIKMKLKEIMMSVDLDEVTSKYIRGRLEEILDMDLGEYKSFIDAEMLIILGQMDAPTEIFDHVYLGSEWNASNLEELQRNGVRHILNVTREIDNFFPGMFDYFNVRVYDDEKTNLLKHWDNTYRYITRARAAGSKVLVHCKMGVSRSASVVIAYAMKAYNWEFQRALQHVKERRSCIKPNKNFLNQLETYSGMLDAMKNKEKLQRSKSETNLKSTKDARLLPGSEPTPLIQALNQAKSKSAGEGAVIINSGMGDEYIENTVVRLTQQRRVSAQKQRRLVRRSSSTSPKTPTAIVMKQQSQSLENLTPERSVADEPKNMRFPGSNGENYSVTQNQVLHINTPTTTSVRTRVHDLEVYRLFGLSGSRSGRSESDETQQQQQQQQQQHEQQHNHIGNNPVWTSSTKLITQTSNLGSASSISAARRDSSSSSTDVFSAQVDHVFANEEQQTKPQRRKTHSWTETSGPSGGIILDTMPNTSIIGTPTSSTTVLRTRTTRHRELPSRHASWGSGDNRGNLQPLRNSSWSYYDTNRNATATAIFEGQIHELKTNALLTNKTATNHNSSSGQLLPPHVGTVKRTKLKLEESSAQKKLCQEEHCGINDASNCCGEPHAICNNSSSSSITTNIGECDVSSETLRRNANLFRSASAVGSTRSRYPLRCNSEELVHNANASGNIGSLVPPLVRRSDGSRPLAAELYSASAPVSYTSSDIENKNTTQEIDTTTVVLRSQSASAAAAAAAAAVAEDQRISGNVQILKQSFEAKAVGIVVVAAGGGGGGGGTGTGTAATNANAPTTTLTAAAITTNTIMAAATTASLPATVALVTTTTSTTANKKSHHSLPSSPMAQHAEQNAVGSNKNVSDNMSTTAITAAMSNMTTTATGLSSSASSSCSSTSSASSSSSSSSSTASSAASSVSETSDRNVKGLVHKYQTTTTCSSNPSVTITTNTADIGMTPQTTATTTAAAASVAAVSNVNTSGNSNSTTIAITGSSTTCLTRAGTTAAAVSNVVIGSSSSSNNLKQRPRSYYDRTSIVSIKTHDYSNSRPPPAPARTVPSDFHLAQHQQKQQHQHSHHHQQQQQQQQQQQPQHRRLAQHGKTHPLTRLSLPKQSFNAAAYNTM